MGQMAGMYGTKVQIQSTIMQMIDIRTSVPSNDGIHNLYPRFFRCRTMFAASVQAILIAFLINFLAPVASVVTMANKQAEAGIIFTWILGISVLMI